MMLGSTSTNRILLFFLSFSLVVDYSYLFLLSYSQFSHTYKYILSAEGYNVEAFTDPQEALKHFVQLPDPSSHYKLAVLDIRIPKLNGLQLFYQMKKLSPRIKIMFCSALEIAEELISVLPDLKHNYIIRKPVEREYFINKINSALNK